MKKYMVFVAFLPVAMGILADDAVITGHGAALKDGLRVSLFRQDGMLGTYIAMDSVRDGRFRLSTPLDSGCLETNLYIDEPGFPPMGRTVYLRPGAEVEIEAADTRLETWTVRSNVPEQEKYDIFLMGSKDLRDSIQDMEINYANSMMSAGEQSVLDSLMQEYKATKPLRDSLFMEIDKRELAILKNLPVDYIWWTKAENLARSYTNDANGAYPDDIRHIFDSLPAKLRNTPEGEKVYAILNPPKEITVGDMVPDNVFYDLEGKEHRFSEFLGKWLLLDIWSQGCYGCIQSIPELSAFASKNAGVAEVISLSVDTDEMWHKSWCGKDITWNSWNEGKEDLGVYRDFRVEGLPTFILVSPEGIVKGKYLGFSDGMFDRLLKLYSTPRETNIVKSPDGSEIVEYPRYIDNQTYGILDIVKVERSPKETRIVFSVDFKPGMWYSINADAHLASSDGGIFKMTGSEGIVPDEKFYTDENGQGSFTLIFEPLPENISEIDFKEKADGGWHINGIMLQ